MESNDIMLPSPPSAFALLRPPRNLASQFELTTHTALPDHPTVADLPRAIWRNKRYVLEESLSRKGSKGRKSWIKRHGLFLVEIDTNDSPLSPYWVCRLCDAKGQPEFFAAAATSSAADHLRKSHRIFESSQAADPDQSTDESERPKRRRLQYSTVPRARVKTIRELSLGLLINTNVPFSFFSDTFFQQLAWQLDPHLADQIPWSRQSMGRLLDDTYKSKKDEIKQELSDALTKIHLGFDLWTSPNRHAVMAVTAHFLDRQGKHQSRLLALRRQLGCHSGENLAVTLGQIVREWKIKDRVGTVISDNASSNDSCLMNFYGDLDAEMSAADVRARRMRCYGHILNLVARAFLYGEDFETFEAESQVFDLLGRREDDLRHWRKKWPVGKIHNVVKFIRSSPQRCELFKRISRENDEAQEYLLASESTAELEVVMNNDTRWNSTYLMISRALIKQGDIRTFLVHPEVEKWLPEADMLKADDWRLLAEIKHILEPFYLQTMRTQGWGSEGGNGRLWEVMTGMEYLLEHLEDRKLFHHAVPDEAAREDTKSQVELARGRPDRNRQLPARFRDHETDMHPRKSRQALLPDRGSRQCDDGSSKPSGSSGTDDMGKDYRHYLRLSIMTAWQKLNEYYTKLGDSPLFAASIILHPSLGMNYLEVNWASEEQLVWVRDAKIGLSDYLDRWYHCNRPVGEQQKMIMDTSTSLSVPRTTTEVSVFKQWIKSRTAKTTVMGSELERYLRLEPQETEDPIEWWMAHQGQFPMISQLALDILAIPAMATDCERSFSLAKLTLTTQRLSMTTETLEKLQCLKNWVRHGAVKLGVTTGGVDEVHWETGDSGMESIEEPFLTLHCDALLYELPWFSETSRLITTMAEYYKFQPFNVKPRVFIISDISNEPDDAESLVRYLLYANELDTRGLVACTSTHIRNKTCPEDMEAIVRGYAQVVDNLNVHVHPDSPFPPAQTFLAMIRSGPVMYGKAALEPSVPLSGGTVLLIDEVDKSMDPLWVLCWGGTNVLAQALHHVHKSRSPEDCQIFRSKIRVYAISDQDDTGLWIRTTFPDIFYICSIHGWSQYSHATWTGISNEADRGGSDSSKITRAWLRENIQIGSFGQCYPDHKFLIEGDTPTFLYLIQNGLGSPEHPERGSWGGRYDLIDPGMAAKHCSDTVDTVEGKDGNWYTSNYATIWRWRDAFQTDFAARMQWTMTKDVSRANHAPLVCVNGNGYSPDSLVLEVEAGQKVVLDASRSYDPDGDVLSFHWFLFKEVSITTGLIAMPQQIPHIQMDNVDPVVPDRKVEISLPAPELCAIEPLSGNPVEKGQVFHFILQVKDNGTPCLTTYKRVIIQTTNNQLKGKRGFAVDTTAEWLELEHRG